MQRQAHSVARLQTLRSTPVSLTVLTRTAQATKVALSVVRPQSRLLYVFKPQASSSNGTDAAAGV